ncbi:MAG TPA: NUDIX hydrolase [Prolixibacteraceae bacterium]|jgi:8-oxo-dGTP diphosphatase|nr:NUDIX hydrolase [Prolixibacteraceae bacterium]
MFTYKYPRPAVTVDAILISKKNSVLLIQRGGEPFKDKWALPGGFIELDESLEDACHRELEEETGIRVGEITQFKAYGSVDRDPRGRTISVIFYSFQEEESVPAAGDDAADAQWFALDHLPELAFDHQIILDEFKAEVLTTD